MSQGKLILLASAVIFLISLTLIYLVLFSSPDSNQRKKKESNSQFIVGAVITETRNPRLPVLLREIDPLTHGLCLEVIKKSPFSVKPEVEFYVEPDLKQMAVTIVNKAGPSWMYFHPLSLAFERQDFEALVAHELGHIDCRCGDEKVEDQIRADQFAVRIVGKDSLRSFLLGYGLTPEHPRVLALR